MRLVVEVDGQPLLETAIKIVDRIEPFLELPPFAIVRVLLPPVAVFFGHEQFPNAPGVIKLFAEVQRR